MMFTSNWVKRRGFRMRLELPTIRCFQGEAFSGAARFESSSPREAPLRLIRVFLWTQIYSGIPEKAVEKALIERDGLVGGETREKPFEFIVPKHSVVGWAGVGL